ncbi:isoprenyl transferase [Candidatus Zixiibacteriota bacterium]
MTTDQKTSDELLEELLKRDSLPGHIAIIMDGNGRWAKARGLDRVEGHTAGVKSVRTVVEAAGAIDLGILTLFTFSNENWKRPLNEVRSLMFLLSETIENEIEDLIRKNVQLRVTGDLAEVPPGPRVGLQRAIELTSANDGLILNLALNYGSRQEILQATEKLINKRMSSGRVGPLTESEFEEHLLTADLPHPDLLIRTSGEQRISNFLLWQIAYAEIYFTETLWPDFDTTAFYQAILDYLNRERRFGMTSDQVAGEA